MKKSFKTKSKFFFFFHETVGPAIWPPLNQHYQTCRWARFSSSDCTEPLSKREKKRILIWKNIFFFSWDMVKSLQFYYEENERVFCPLYTKVNGIKFNYHLGLCAQSGMQESNNLLKYQNSLEDPNFKKKYYIKLKLRSSHAKHSTTMCFSLYIIYL